MTWWTLSPHSLVDADHVAWLSDSAIHDCISGILGMTQTSVLGAGVQGGECGMQL